MTSTLDRILATTRATLPALAARRAELERAAAATPVPPSFEAALRADTVALIAEVKRRSPSAGEIQAALDPVAIARTYDTAGAAAISVLTDGPFFGGALADLTAVTAAVRRPALRKDFILHEDQLAEARAHGASAALLIVRALTPARLGELLRAAAGFGLDVLVETHDARELDIALEAGARIVGVNSRNLDTFAIDIDAAWALIGRVPAALIAVAESGMATRADVERAAAAGADAVLIGTALSGAADPLAATRAVVGVPRRRRTVG